MPIHGTLTMHFKNYNNNLTIQKKPKFLCAGLFFLRLPHHELFQVPTNVDQFPITSDPLVDVPTIPMGTLLPQGPSS